jgi:hypothetical protein
VTGAPFTRSGGGHNVPASYPRSDLRCCQRRKTPANHGKPTRGFEPRTPSLRVKFARVMRVSFRCHACPFSLLSLTFSIGIVSRELTRNDARVSPKRHPLQRTSNVGGQSRRSRSARRARCVGAASRSARWPTEPWVGHPGVVTSRPPELQAGLTSPRMTNVRRAYAFPRAPSIFATAAASASSPPPAADATERARSRTKLR